MRCALYGESFANLYKNDKLALYIEVFNNSTDDVMFIHIREPEEIDRVVKDFDALSVLIKRKNIKVIHTYPQIFQKPVNKKFSTFPCG